MRALTNNPPDSDTSSDGSLESHKAHFKEATAKYFSVLSSIDVRLRRQLYALEEASLFRPDSAVKPGDVAGGGAGAVGAAGSVSGSTDPLDISWLNSRKDTVGKDKEAELWTAARSFVEQLDTASDGLNGTIKQEGNDSENSDSEKMQVD